MIATATRSAIVAAALLLLVGCGRGSVPETIGVDAAGSGAASTIPFASESGPIPIVPTPGTAPTTPGSGSTAGDAAFCQDLNEQLASLPNVLSQLGSPDQRNTVLQQITAANAKLVHDAPAAVRPAAQTLARITNKIVDDVSATPPNLDDVSKQFSDPAYVNASAELGRYAGQHCGLIPAP
jgi:hypothetical protein